MSPQEGTGAVEGPVSSGLPDPEPEGTEAPDWQGQYCAAVNSSRVEVRFGPDTDEFLS